MIAYEWVKYVGRAWYEWTETQGRGRKKDWLKRKSETWIGNGLVNIQAESNRSHA